MTAAFIDHTKPHLPVADSMFRGSPAPVVTESVQVDRKGGDFRSGVIRGVSLIAAGEALGHEMWIDQTTLEQVVELGQQGKHGVKSRFTHPSMSADGTGRHLGRIRELRVEDNRVVGDLHFAESAHSTPDGDLAGYVMTLAEEDPNAAGLSIAFMHDEAAMDEFAESNTTSGEFISPDESNVNNYPHVRISSLRAADVVDEPAANPDGLFDRQSLARDVDDLLSYAAGISEIKPNAKAFGVDADRASQFVGRWLSSHDLSIVPTKELAAMAETQTQPTQEPATPSKTELLAELKAEQKQFADRFGAVDGATWHSDGKSYAESMELFADKQAEQIAELQSQLAEATEKLESFSIGEDDPVETTPGDQPVKRSLFAATGPSSN